jgi:hypothetical protein|tara:strand:+ start:259 stop:387 length:129 start_codon:yes stop_codon:yes gene_type:complete
MNEEQQEEAQTIWAENIDGETYIHSINKVSDKLTNVDSGISS